MGETPLTGRAILMVVLGFVIFSAAGLASVFIVSPSANEPAASRLAVVICAIVGTLALIWFVYLAIRAIKDIGRGIEHAPARISGWFHIVFGFAIAVGGAVCTWLTYEAVVASGGGVWKLFWGMIAWGLAEMCIGVVRAKNE